MNASDFLRSFVEDCKKTKHAASDEEWTKTVHPIFFGIGNRNGYKVRCKSLEIQPDTSVGNSEFKKLDYCYFPPKIDSEKYNFLTPAAVIEHENNVGWPGIRKDFWKICRQAVPLRIYIGYQDNERAAS